MSGVLVIPNQFATAVTATGAQLDGDFNTVTAYINDPTNRNNFVADGGAATNTIVLTFSPPVTGGYTTGLEITFKPTNTNTGPIVLNANGLGNKNLVNPDGSAMASGELRGGSVYKAVYDGTQFVCVGVPLPHPGIAKAWALFDGTVAGTSTVNIGYNVGTVVRNGTGSYSVSFVTAMADTSYAVVVTPVQGGANVTGRGVGTVSIFIFNTATQVALDVTGVHFTAYGRQ